MVQYRDKSNDTGVLVETARKLHQVTKKYKVPLLINDRVDVALAIGAEGVHLGQDDMSSSQSPYANQIICTDLVRIRAGKAAATKGCHHRNQHFHR